MKKTIAVLGSAAALSLSGAGLAAAQDGGENDQNTAPGATTQNETAEEQTPGDENQEPGNDEGADDDVDTPEEVSAIAQQLCGSISAYDFLGSAAGVVPGLAGEVEECEANADLAVQTAMTGDIGGALDILRGIDTEPGEGDEGGSGSADLLESIGGDADDADDAGDDTDTVESETLEAATA